MVNISSFKTNEDLYEFGYQIVHKIKCLEDRHLNLTELKDSLIHTLYKSTDYFEKNEITDFYNSVINSIQQEITELKTQLKALNKVRIELE